MAGWFASTAVRQSQHRASARWACNPDAIGIHISIWLLLPVAAAWRPLAGVVIGLPTLRLRGDYLAIVTLGFGEIIPQVVRNGDNCSAPDSTSPTASPGITPIDPLGFGYLHGILPFLPTNFLIVSNLPTWYYRDRAALRG